MDILLISNPKFREKELSSISLGKKEINKTIISCGVVICG